MRLQLLVLLQTPGCSLDKYSRDLELLFMLSGMCGARSCCLSQRQRRVSEDSETPKFDFTECLLILFQYPTVAQHKGGKNRWMNYSTVSRKYRLGSCTFFRAFLFAVFLCCSFKRQHAGSCYRGLAHSTRMFHATLRGSAGNRLPPFVRHLSVLTLQ